MRTAPPTVAGLRLCLALLLGSPVFAQQPSVRYGRDVRPILADRCFRCHGPDAKERAADLRLDEREAALAARPHGAAIVPGHPEQSLLWQRVLAHDDDRMPPVDSGKPRLSPGELAVIEAWIRQGAPYEPHWAFVPPTRPPLPDVATFPHPIDRFLAEARTARGLQPGPAADRETLVRRVFLVLTGLPPTPTELDTQLADAAPDAYERLVDRLLGEEPYRTRHAEHLARIWLDAGRYADTSGIHMDAGRQAYLWRDWLITTLADDRPYDECVVEMLAGDLLPGATAAQRVATGFLRNHVTTDEGGAIDEEYRVEYAAERTATVGSVFLGLTLNCARCHDHKYDPIAQEDYYRLFAFFNQNDEPGLYSQSPDAFRALEPFLLVPTPAQQQRREQLAPELAAARAARDTMRPEDRADFDRFLAAVRAAAAADWSAPQLRSAQSTKGSTLTIEADGSVFVSGDNPAKDEHVLTFCTTAADQRALLFEGLPDARLPAGKVGRSDNGNVVLQHVRLEGRRLGADGPFAEIPLVFAAADVEQADGDFVANNVLADDDRGWAVAAHQHGPQPTRLLLLAAAPFGDGPVADSITPGAPAPTELRLTLRYDSRYAQHTFGRFHLRTSALGAALLPRLPISSGPFHLAGPFLASNKAALYDTSFGPEAARDLAAAARFGEVAWRRDASLREGVANTSLPAGPSVTFVAQRVFAPTARRAEILFGSDDGFQLFLDGTMLAERRIDRGVAVDQERAELQLSPGWHLLVLKIVNTGGIGGFALRHLPGADELGGDQLLGLLPDDARDEPAVARQLRAWRERHSPQHQELVGAVQRLEAELEELARNTPRAMVMREADRYRETFVLSRGEYDKPARARPVTRELPAMFGRLPDDAPHDRLGLARWLVSAADPLFDRVAVNRLWEFVFGTGLVRTSEDFGLQGEWPSHAELLDWLACEFRDGGHHLRPLLRLLVTSAAFRQASRAEPTAATVDPDNRLLAWFPRRRLTAEALRDQALYVAGLLVEQTGGPSVKPYQPPGLWQEVAMVQSNTRTFVRGSGDDLWRRSLYTYWKRACPPPTLLLLDAPTREFCTIRRLTTNTPLQALAMWNDEQFVEAARVLAERALSELPDDAARVASMLRRCTGRLPDAEAMRASLATLQLLQERYRRDPEAAAALAAVGARPPLARLEPTRLAPLVLLANAFLNLDACVCID
ncbi:MAG: PSD1 domain-containing protein [Planctomycetes bacterium]|nr:PSD1 domain-containing protein [Planctomycetota bacterium]